MKNCFSSFLKKSTSTISSSYHSGGHYDLDNDGKIIGVVDDLDILYGQLEKRLDLCLLPYPRSEDFEKIIKLIFRPEDIPIITHIKLAPTRPSEVAERVGIPLETAEEKLDEMAHRGLLTNFSVNGHDFVILPEFVVGWYEFVLIWLSMEGSIEEFESFTGEKFEDLNVCMSNYLEMYAVSCDLREGFTSVLRATPYFDDVEKKEFNVLTYENVKDMFESADIISVVNCPCKFHESEKSGIPIPDDIPKKCCYQIGLGAEAFLKIGVGEEITLEKALEEVEYLMSKGHMFNCENSKDVGYICACHKDWCGVRKTFETNGFYGGHRSGFYPIFDIEKCIGCGICVERCPVDVLQLVEKVEEKEEKEEEEGKKKKKRKKKVVEMVENGLDTCVGCLNCKYGCKVEAITFDRRSEEETYDISEDVVEYSVRVAFEQGKFYTMIFDDPQSKVQDVLRSVASVVENNPISNAIKRNEKFSKCFVKFASNIGRKDFLKSVGLTESDL